MLLDGKDMLAEDQHGGGRLEERLPARAGRHASSLTRSQAGFKSALPALSRVRAP